MNKDARLIDTMLKPMIIRDLERLCEKAEYEFNRQEFGSAWALATIKGIPVTVKIYPLYPDGNIVDHVCIEIETGPREGIRHTMKPVTKDALSKVADDILKVEPWEDSEPIEKEQIPVHTVEYFDLNNKTSITM